MRALWDTSWAKQGRSMAGSARIKEKHGIHCAANDSTLYLFVSSVSKEIEDASDLQKRASF